MRALWSSGNVWGMHCRREVPDRALPHMPAEYPAGCAGLQGIAIGLIGCLICSL